jgi:DNA-binding NtrC family response regulator
MVARSAAVLVVDDESSIRDTTVALLEDDYEVAEAANGRDALKLLNTRRFDVICTDYRMPGMTGIELLRQAQKLQPAASGIIITAYADYPEYQSTLREVPCLVVLKPYEPQALCELVARAARLSKMKQTSQDVNEQTGRLAASKPKVG